MGRKRRKQYNRVNGWIKGLVSFGVVVLVGAAGLVYMVIYKPNIHIPEQPHDVLHIPTGATFPHVLHTLKQKGWLMHTMSFEWLAEHMNYKGNVLPGRYKLKDGMSNVDLIRLLRSGKQEPLNITFTKVRRLGPLVSRFSQHLEADSARLMQLLHDDNFLQQYGFNSQQVMAMFIPNTYEFYWNTNAREVIARMHREYVRFWTDERLSRLERLGLSPIEAIILASIVEEEVMHASEKRRIAGVYMNRLRKGIKLQADPTVRFALKYTVHRILSRHIHDTDSPYNTYKNKGLPPGPICTPPISTIDATLQAEQHDYLYFCAKEDFSGYHYFSKSFRQHVIYAQRYRRALNERKIYK